MILTRVVFVPWNRCVFNASLSDEEMPDISGETFKALQQRDLVMNIWRDGSWGSFRHLPALAGMLHVF